MSEKIAVVTGANRGLGFAVVKMLCERHVPIVYLTSRDERRGQAAVTQLQHEGLHPRYHQLDVTDDRSVNAFAEFIKKEHGQFDYLVNNAGIMDYEEPFPSYEAAKRNIDVNYRSLVRVEKYLFPLLRDGARVVNVSSACGHLSNLRNQAWVRALADPALTEDRVEEFVRRYLDSVRDGSFRPEDFADGGKHAEHRVSKIAATALTMIQARKYAARHISVNALHPGQLATDMARGAGVTPPADAAALVGYLLLDASPALSAAYMGPDRKLVDWYDHEGDYYYVHQDV